MSPRFILLWNDENNSDRNARRLADGVDEAARRIRAFLDGRMAYDEEKADEEFYADTLTPALEGLAEEVASEDLAAFPAGMGTGESRELRCENGAFEIVRDR